MSLTTPPALTFHLFLQLRNKEATSSTCEEAQAEEGAPETATEGDAAPENTPETEAKKDGVCG